MILKWQTLILGILVIFNNGCECDKKQHKSIISKDLFQHQYITRDLPDESDWGYGCPTLTDFDNDGDLDYSFSGINYLYWFENKDINTWERHDVGALPIPTLGAASVDVDKDGASDIVIGGYWFRNTIKKGNTDFVRDQYDDRIKSEIHDIVLADIDGDGKKISLKPGRKKACFGIRFLKIQQKTKTGKEI